MTVVIAKIGGGDIYRAVITRFSQTLEDTALHGIVP